MEGPDPLPLGVSGRLEVLSLRNPSGDAAALVREDGTPRALVTAEPVVEGRERVVVTPLDADVEVHVDGDALAIWLASGSLTGPARSAVPGWASAIGLLLLLVTLALAVLGSATFFDWLLGLIGG